MTALGIIRRTHLSIDKQSKEVSLSDYLNKNRWFAMNGREEKGSECLFANEWLQPPSLPLYISLFFFPFDLSAEKLRPFKMGSNWRCCGFSKTWWATDTAKHFRWTENDEPYHYLCHCFPSLLVLVLCHCLCSKQTLPTKLRLANYCQIATRYFVQQVNRVKLLTFVCFFY